MRYKIKNIIETKAICCRVQGLLLQRSIAKSFLYYFFLLVAVMKILMEIENYSVGVIKLQIFIVIKLQIYDGAVPRKTCTIINMHLNVHQSSFLFRTLICHHKSQNKAELYNALNSGDSL